MPPSPPPSLPPDPSDVVAMRPFLPATDLALSMRFYTDLGFTAYPMGEALATMRLGSFKFLLQQFQAAGFAENYMMHLLVRDLSAWWRHIESLGLAAKYGVRAPTPPAMQPWGIVVAYVVDPSGVLWHFAQFDETVG